MYIESLTLKNIRTFVDETLEFVHPDRAFRSRKKTTENGSPLLPKPRLPNVNLLLGDNGSGKSTVLRAIAMAALGPSFEDTKLPTSELVRRAPGEMYWNTKGESARIEADLLLHDQDRAAERRLRSAFNLTRRGELERRRSASKGTTSRSERPISMRRDEACGSRCSKSKNLAFFAVGYGATTPR